MSVTDNQNTQQGEEQIPGWAKEWAKTILEKVNAIEEQNKQLEAQREEYLAQRSQSQQGSNEGVIHLSFGDIPNTAENRQMEAAYGQDTAHLKPYDPIAEIRATAEGQERWSRIREAHAAYMAERDQNRVLSEEEEQAKAASRERAAKAMGFAGDKGFWK